MCCVQQLTYRKLIQLICSLFLLLLVIIQAYFQLRYPGESRYLYAILGFMGLTLITNVVYCIWNSTYQLFALETFFYNLYFLSIVGFVIKEYLKKKNHLYQRYRTLYIFLMIINGCLMFAIFIESLIDTSNQTHSKCQAVWYLCVNGQCLFLCVLTTTILIVNHIQQKKKISKYIEKNPIYFDAKKINNPFKIIWIWLGLNILSQAFNMIQSGLYLSAIPSEHCRIISQNVANAIVKLIFVFTNMYTGFLATIVYLFYTRYKQKNSLSTSEQLDYSGQYDEYSR